MTAAYMLEYQFIDMRFYVVVFRTGFKKQYHDAANFTTNKDLNSTHLV